MRYKKVYRQHKQELINNRMVRGSFKSQEKQKFTGWKKGLIFFFLEFSLNIPSTLSLNSIHSDNEEGWQLSTHWSQVRVRSYTTWWVQTKTKPVMEYWVSSNQWYTFHHLVHDAKKFQISVKFMPALQLWEFNFRAKPFTG